MGATADLSFGIAKAAWLPCAECMIEWRGTLGDQNMHVCIH